MRLRELLEDASDYMNNMSLDVDNILIKLIASGKAEVGTEEVVKYLQNLGYSVTSNSLVDILSNNQMVQSATPSVVTLTGSTISADKTEDSADQVADMAQKASKL